MIFKTGDKHGYLVFVKDFYENKDISVNFYRNKINNTIQYIHLYFGHLSCSEL